MTLPTMLHNLLRRWRSQAADEPGAPDDARLLERFVADRDPLAFEVLVWRHGAMVLGVCRRLLHQRCDVEDAFQATFLTLVRKAASVRRGRSLAGWLYQVAYRIALRLRTTVRRSRLESLAQEPASKPTDAPVDEDLRAVLDEEIHRLPENYRLAVVLCYLQGLTTAEAAARLGCPRGTFLSRLAWARRRLMERLTRRGVTPLAALAVLATTRTAPAAALVTTAVQAGLRYAAGGAVSSQVAALVNGVVQAMFVNKLKWAVALVMVMCLGGTGLGWWAYRGNAGRPEARAGRPPDERRPNDEAGGDRAVPPAKKPAADEDREKALAEEKERLLRKANVELDRAEREADELEKKLSEEMVQLRLALMQAEEELRSTERQEALKREEIQAELKKIDREMAEVDKKVARPEDAKKLKAPLEERAARLRAMARESRDRAELREKMVKAEEDIRLAERLADRARARAADHIEEATARLRQAQGQALPEKTPDLRSLERKLDRLQREVEELRRELRRSKE
jgi:RNA polymerase sigma factor (sigma-70 family)